jgi:hypothetical protein
MNWLKSLLSGFTTPSASEMKTACTGGNFTPRAQRALALARREADRFNHNFVSTEHLLLGIIRLNEGVAVNVLLRMGLNLETVRVEVEKQVGTGPREKVAGNVPYTPRVKKVLALAARASKSLGHTYVGTEHILLGLLGEGDGVACRILTNLNVAIEQTRQEILKELDPDFSSAAEDMTMKSNAEPPGNASQSVDITKRYDLYCRDHDREVVYRNALLKGIRTLFKAREYDTFSEYMEVEQANGQTVFISRHSISRFCEPGVNPTPEVVRDKPKDVGKG